MSLDAPAISVIVPYYDSERYLRQCLDSLLSQKPVAGVAEVILIDNGSTDASADIVAEYEGRVVALHEEGAGAYRARNAALRVARAPLIAFTDADCRVAPDWLCAIERAMADSTIGIVVGECSYPPESSPRLRILGAYENGKTRFVIEQCAPEYHYAYANNMAVRASVFEQLGPFQEWRRAGDSELVHRMAAQLPELRLAYSEAMRVCHLEFVQARTRMRRMRLYTETNSKIATFRELSLWQRLAILGRLVF